MDASQSQHTDLSRLSVLQRYPPFQVAATSGQQHVLQPNQNTLVVNGNQMHGQHQFNRLHHAGNSFITASSMANMGYCTQQGIPMQMMLPGGLHGGYSTVLGPGGVSMQAAMQVYKEINYLSKIRYIFSQHHAPPTILPLPSGWGGHLDPKKTRKRTTYMCVCSVCVYVYIIYIYIGVFFRGLLYVYMH